MTDTSQGSVRDSHLLTGPVAVTGADGHLGRAVRRALDGLSNPVRPLGRDDDWAAAIRDAEAVIHLAGTLQPRRPDTLRSANIGTAARCAAAVARSSVERVVVVSYVGARPSHDNAYLRAKGEAEHLLSGSGRAAVIVRSTYICGDSEDIGPSFAAYRTRPGGTVRVLGSGRQRTAPIHVDDLAHLLAAAATDLTTPTGVVEVGGPTVLDLDELVRRLNPPDVTVRHIPAGIARLLGRLVPDLNPALVDLQLRDSVPATDPRDVAAQFGVRLREVVPLVPEAAPAR